MYVCICMYIHIKNIYIYSHTQTHTQIYYIDTKKEDIFHWSLHTWTEAKLIIDNTVDWQIQQKYFNTAKYKVVSLEINFRDNKYVTRESGEAVTQEKEKDIKGPFITDSQQTFQVNALARENNVCPWDVKGELKKKKDLVSIFGIGNSTKSSSHPLLRSADCE